jgi:hypothetical protein
LLKQFYHWRIATQLQKAGKNRLISIDLIKVNFGNYGQLVAVMPSGNAGGATERTKTTKMRLKNHKSLPISCPQTISSAYFTHPFLQ